MQVLKLLVPLWTTGLKNLALTAFSQAL